jgi:hypothetical protein
MFLAGRFGDFLERRAGINRLHVLPFPIYAVAELSAVIRREQPKLPSYGAKACGPCSLTRVDPAVPQSKVSSIEIIGVSGDLRNRRDFVAGHLARLPNLAFVVARGNEIHDLTETDVKLVFTGSRDSQSPKVIEGACAKRPPSSTCRSPRQQPHSRSLKT